MTKMKFLELHTPTCLSPVLLRPVNSGKHQNNQSRRLERFHPNHLSWSAFRLFCAECRESFRVYKFIGEYKMCKSKDLDHLYYTTQANKLSEWLFELLDAFMPYFLSSIIWFFGYA